MHVSAALRGSRGRSIFVRRRNVSAMRSLSAALCTIVFCAQACGFEHMLVLAGSLGFRRRNHFRAQA